MFNTILFQILLVDSDCWSKQIRVRQYRSQDNSNVYRIRPTLRLHGGGDTGIPEVEDAKFAAREAQWQQWREEWEYCTGKTYLVSCKSRSI
jgi:hypothetical protein